MLFESEKTFFVKGEEENNICIYNEPCDEFMKSHGLLFAASAKVNFGETIVNLIVTDSHFSTLDEKTQLFFIYHEVGHIKHGHLNLSEKYGKLIILKRCLGFLPAIEVQADCYAASIIGKDAAKAVLRNLYKNKKLPFMSRFEAFKRSLRVKEIPLG